MNKIFRVIYSQATQSWVAVSELTKAHKKQSSSSAKKSASGSSANLIKSSAIALALLSGHSAYAALNDAGTGSGAVAQGTGSVAAGGDSVAIGASANSTGSRTIAIGKDASTGKDDAIAIGNGAKAENPNSVAIGKSAISKHNNAVAIGIGAKALGPTSLALVLGAKATGDDSYAIGVESESIGKMSIAFGQKSKARQQYDLVFGTEANTRDQGQGHSIAIGYGAMSGTNNAGKNLNGGDAGGVAIGTGAYTGVNKDDGRSVNSSVAIGAGAGAGFRNLDANKMPAYNRTDVDSNEDVLKKAFGVKDVADYQKIAGGTNGYTNVDINEATALGRNARAIGDQSVAIGAQTIAGMGAIALGGNDITQFANKKYYKSTKENFAVTETEDHNQDAEISKDTISDAYKRLVDTKLDTKYKATYAQDGSVVLGAQAHSGTPLGTALGTNALVRKGAFGATAIGAGSQVQANAEAAVAIGMGSFADGKYAVAAGTASLAKEGDVAIGYKAKATGKEGALAIGLGTNARGDSSIMIGGADVESASKQSTTFEKAIGVNEKGGVIAKDVVEKINGKEVTRHYTFAATKTTTGTVAAAFQELTGHAMDVSSLDFSKAENKNGHASTSLGVHSLAKGDLATAIGTSARADVIGSLALGTGAHATLQNAVAIGTGSTTELLGTRQLSVNYDSEGNIVSDDSKDIAYTFKWAGGTNTSEGDVVSFGSSGAERQLKNVAAGRVAEDSTDAINGSQLNSITKKIAAGFNTSGNVVADSSGVFTSKKANTDSADKAYETAIRSQDKVQLQVGNNLKLDRDETEVEIEVQDDFDKTKTVKKKVKKADFAYSLNPVLTNLTSAEFKADGKPTVNISSDGITITPAAPTTGGEQKPNVSLTENGLNNGGNTITNVAGNLNGAKKDTTAPTTKADKPNNVDDIKNNAATVGDVLNAGWNLQGNGTAKDFVTAYDIVNFIDGEGTSVSVENTDNKTSKIKYSVNLGDGLEKDATTNKIKAKVGNGVTVGADGIKVNTGKGLKIDAANGSKVAVDTDDETITVGTDGKVKAVTGSTETVTDTNKGTDEKAGQVRPVKADKGKLATVDAVANAVNNAAWSITSGTDGGSFATSGHTKTTEKISAGGSVTFKAGNNLIIKQAGTDFTYSLNPILSGLTSAEFKGTGENAPITKLTNAGITVTTPADAVANTPEKTVTLNQDGLNNGGNAISNVKSNLPATKNSDTANTEAAPSNATKTQAVPNTTNMKGTDYVNPNNAATVGDVLNAGWNLKGKGTAVDFVKAYDTVDFVDGDGTTASVESKDGQTSTVKYSVNTTTIKPDTANAGKVKAEGTGNTFATAETVASAINDAYWKAAASGNGATTDVADNVKAGNTVTFKAGKNLTVTHNNTNKSFEFATTDTPEFSSVQFGNNGPKITHDGNTIKVSGANGTDSVKITNVADGKDDNDAVNVSQLKASGWNIAGNGKTKVDTINKDDQVNFLNGSGTTVTVEKDKGANGKETGNVNVKYDVNVGNGLQKDTASNTISVKPADKSLEVTNDGVKVKAADKTLTTDTNGLKVNTGNITASSVPTVADADKDKIATVGNVADAIKAAAWKATSAATTSGENTGKKEQEVKAGDTVTFEADKNIKITQAEGKFTFATKDDVKFDSVQLGGDSGPKLTKADGNDLKVSGSNGTDPVKITNVADGNISADSKDAINGSQFNAVANNNIKLGGDNNSATDGQSLNKAGGLKFNINGADGIETKASGDSVTVKINTETKAKIDSVDNKADKNLSNITADGETKIKNLVTWKAKASNSGDELAEGDKTADSDTDAQQVGADGVLTLDAGKNLLLKRSEKTFTYALSKTLSDLTSAEFKKGDVTTKIDGDGLTIQAPTLAGGTAPKAITINKDGISAGDKAIKDVNSGLTNYGGTDAKKDLINLGDPITGSKVPDNNAATVGDLRNMGWIVSSDKSTGENGAVTTDAYSATVKNADEVKFVGTHAAKVSGKTVNGVRTITVDVEVPDAKTAKLVSSKDGSVIAPSTDSKLQDALKTAKDELAALPNTATEAEKEAAKNKVKAAETALNDAVDNKGVATAKNVADMINNSGFTLKTSKAEGGNKDTASVGSEVINPGKTVEMVAGKNLTVKQDAGGKVTYSLNPELINLTSAEFKADGKPTVKISSDGIVITPNSKTSPTVSLTENGLNNGGNAITNVAGNLPSTKNNDAAATDPSNATKSQAAPTLGNTANQVNPTNAATVSDVLNAGWNLQGNGNAVDFVKPYDTVNFVNGDGTSVAVESEDGKTSTVKYSANLGDGLEKTGDNKIKVKAADKSLEVTNEGVKVKAADNTLTTDTNGLKVNTGSITTAAVPTVTAGDENKIATVGNVADAIKAAAWNATSAATTSGENTGTKVQPVKAGETVTFEADKNIKIAQADGKFTFSTKDNVEFNTVKVGAPETYKDENGQSVVKTNDGKFYPASKVVNGVPNKGAQEVPADKVKAENPQVSFTRKDAKLAENNDTGKVPSTALDVSSTDGKPTQITGVGSTLNVKPVDTNPNGTATTGNARPNLIDLVGTDTKPVNKNAAATVGDLQNMGWKVSSDKTTGADGAYLDVVKNADEVKFVGEGTATVTGKTDDKGVRTITVKVDDQVSTNNAVTPVVYTKADGTKVYPVKNAQGNIEYHTTPDGKGEGDQKVDDGDVITSVNGPKGTTKPTTLSNVAGNLNGAKTGTNAPTTNAAAPNTTDATKPNYVNTHNAATVGDVLNAGWNLQNNGTAKDFVKPFDTVNFVNGGNTTAVVTTKADGTTSDVTFNVTGLPIATTIATPDGPVQLTKVGDNYYPVKADGTPDIKTDTDGNPTNGYVKADNGNYYPAGDVTFTKDPATKVTTVTPKDGKQPVTFGNSLTNPNVVNTTDAPNKAVAAPTTLDNVKGNLPTVNDADKTAHDVDGAPIADKSNTAAPITAADAADLLTPMKDGAANPKFVGNNAATVSDVLNAGWNLQNNGTAKDFVKPYDTVNFINGANTTAVVTTNAEGTASTVTYNVTGLPVTYTTADGTPVSKIGDKFYKVNDKGQPIDEQGNPSTKVNNNGEPIDGNGNVIKPVDTSTNPLSTNLVNPNVTEPNKKTTSPTQLGNVTSGLQKYGDQVNGADVPGTNDKNRGLVDLSKPATGEPKVSDNTAATVGDLRNMGWIVSAEKTTGDLTKEYSDTVKNANEVKFVGEGTATVTGKTDDKGVRTITVKVDDQVSTNNAVTPVVYTKADGTKVYPTGKKDTAGNLIFNTKADGTGDDVPNTDVITSVNGPKGTISPTTLSNVAGNLEGAKANTNAPTTNAAAPNTTDAAQPNYVNTHNAATVGDVLNAGWNLQNNGAARDFVKPYDTVNFINGKGTVAVVETAADATSSTVKFDVDAGEITADKTKPGAVKGPITADEAKRLADDLANAQNAVNNLAPDADEATKKAAQDALKAAQAAAAPLNKVATAQNVANMINNSGFTLKTSAIAEGKKDAASTGDEVINPGKAVEMVAGKNLTVKQEANGKVTYATKDNVSFNTVNVGGDNTYVDENSKPVTKKEDGTYVDENGQPVEESKVTKLAPVAMKAEKAKPATNNGNEAKDQPTTALNVSSTDGKPTQITGVGSTLNVKPVDTNPNGTTTTGNARPNLIDLVGTDTKPVNKNAAATVGDLQNMGWVVSTKDGNGYTDVVRNADKVDFKGSNGIEVRGSTAADGTRVITVSAKEGKVTNKVEITKTDGSKVDAVIIDGKYYERDENGKPKTDTEIPAADIKAADNGGSGFVTGNTVANAINDSGWNVGLADGKKAEAAFAGGGKALSDSALEKVNPDDNLRFADGKNTKVKAATVDEINKDGRKITNTYVKFDVELPIGQIENVSRDAEGNAVKKVGDKWYPADQVKEDGTLKDPVNSTALSDEEAEKVATGNVAAMDPENKGDKYKSANQVEKGLTTVQMGELAGKQAAAAEAAKLKIENLLKNQPKDVVDAASEAAVKAAQDEAKAQYLKEKGLDKGTGGTVISNLARGTAPGDAVNVDQLQNSGWNLDSKAVAGSSGKVISGNVSPSKVKMDETVNIDAGNNIEITRNGKNIGIATSMTPQFSSVSLGAGADAPTLSVDNEGALNVGSKDANKPVRITNVAPGVKEGDVTNVAQLKGVAQNLNNRIDNVDGNARAGIAQAIATAGLVQAYLPGKSMMAIGGGTYRGEAGYAIGYSSISDGGNWIIKGTASGNSRGHFGASASVGYQW